MAKTKKRFLGIGVIAAIAVLTFAFAIAASGSDGGVIEQNAEGVTVAASEVTASISYQGRMADSAGEPLSGTYDMTFRLYKVASGGTVLDTDTHSVEVTAGLFNTNIDFDQKYFNGRELWLGIIVGKDAEMTPRQEFRPVPYALSLRPGAYIRYDGNGPTFSVQNGWPGGVWHMAKKAIAGWTSDGTALWGAAGSGTGVSGISRSGTGVYGRTDSTDHAGVFAKGKDSGADLILGGNAVGGAGDDGRIYSDPNYPSSDIFLITNDCIQIELDNDGDGEDADFKILDKNNKLIFNVDESGDMFASGTKNAVVATEDYGTRKMYALESTEVWFEDFGMTQLQDGVAVVEIDPVFAETVNLSVAYHVFFTPVDGWAPIYVANKTSTSFEVRDAHDESDITLEYRIVAKRLGYEDARMVQVESGNEEA